MAWNGTIGGIERKNKLACSVLHSEQCPLSRLHVKDDKDFVKSSFTTFFTMSSYDLKAFERRLMEVISYYQPQTKRWRVMLGVSFFCTVLGAWQWLMDPQTSQLSFLQSLMNNLFFTISSGTLIILFLMGIHKRVVAPSIIVSRVRQVLADFNMSCDDNGRLILRPRPTT